MNKIYLNNYILNIARQKLESEYYDKEYDRES